MGWMDILKGPKDDNRRMINKIIEYLEKEIEKLPNIEILSKGEMVDVINGDARELILGLKDEEGEFGENEEEDIVRMMVGMPRQIDIAESEGGPPPEIISMMQAIGMPVPRGEQKEDLWWHIEIDFKYDFFGILKEANDIFEVIEDLKLINKSRNPPEDLR